MLNQYSASAPLFTNLQAARSAAETRRKAGSHFVIKDKPALAFDFGKQSLVVVNLNVSKPFANWTLPPNMANRKSAVPAEDVLQAFSENYLGHPTSGWNGPHPTVVIGITDSKALSPHVKEGARTLWASYVQSGSMLYRTYTGQAVDFSALDHIAWEMGHRGLTDEPAEPRHLRVYQLAAQLRVKTKSVRELLEQIGTPAKGPRSWIEPHTVEEVRRLRFLHDRI